MNRIAGVYLHEERGVFHVSIERKKGSVLTTHFYRTTRGERLKKIINRQIKQGTLVLHRVYMDDEGSLALSFVRLGVSYLLDKTMEDRVFPNRTWLHMLP